MNKGEIVRFFNDRLDYEKQQPYLIISPDGQIMECNWTFCKLTGYTKDELKKLRWNMDLTPAEWRQKEAETLDLLCQNGEPRVYRKELLHKNRSRIPVEVVAHAITGHDGKVHKYLAFINILPRHKHSRKSWRKQRAYFTLLGYAPSIYYRCKNDRKWTMKWIEGDCYKLTGYHAEDLIDNKTVAWGDLIPPDDLERTWDVAQMGLRDSRPFQQEYRIITANGTEKWVLEQCLGIVNSKGEEFFEGFITDITERRRSEEQLRALLHDYENMASEINNLTSKVISHLYMIQDTIDHKAEALMMIQKSIEDLLCIQSQLNLAKESVKIDFHAYARLAEEVEFIYDGKDYFFLK